MLRTKTNLGLTVNGLYLKYYYANCISSETVTAERGLFSKYLLICIALEYIPSVIFIYVVNKMLECETMFRGEFRLLYLLTEFKTIFLLPL